MLWTVPGQSSEENFIKITSYSKKVRRTSKHLLRFIKKTLKTNSEQEVIKGKTLQKVFDDLGISAYFPVPKKYF